MMKSKFFASVVFVALFLTSHLAQAGLWDTLIIRGTQTVLRNSLLRRGVPGVGMNAINQVHYHPVIQNERLMLQVPRYTYVTVTNPLLQDNNNNPSDDEGPSAVYVPNDGQPQMGMVIDFERHRRYETYETEDEELMEDLQWWVDYLREGNPYPTNIGQRTEMLVDMALAQLSLHEKDEEEEVEEAEEVVAPPEVSLLEEGQVLEEMTEDAVLSVLVDVLRLADNPVELVRDLESEVLRAIPDWIFVQETTIRNRLVAGSPADFFFELMRRRNRLDDHAMLAAWYRMAEAVRFEVQRAVLVRNVVDGLIEQEANIDGLRMLYYDSVESVLNEMTGAWEVRDLLKTVQGTVLESFVQWIVKGNLGGLAEYQDIMLWNAYFEEHVFPVIGEELEAAIKKMGKGKQPKAKKKKKERKKRAKKILILDKE